MHGRVSSEDSGNFTVKLGLKLVFLQISCYSSHLLACRLLEETGLFVGTKGRVRSFGLCQDPDLRKRFGLDGEGWSATERQCTRTKLTGRNHEQSQVLIL